MGARGHAGVQVLRRPVVRSVPHELRHHPAQIHQASDERPDTVYQVCGSSLCLMSCFIAYTAQYVHIGRLARIGLRPAGWYAHERSASMASAILVDMARVRGGTPRGHRVAIVLSVQFLVFGADARHDSARIA